MVSRHSPQGGAGVRRAFNHALTSCLHEFTHRGIPPTHSAAVLLADFAVTGPARSSHGRVQDNEGQRRTVEDEAAVAGGGADVHREEGAVGHRGEDVLFQGGG